MDGAVTISININQHNVLEPMELRAKQLWDNYLQIHTPQPINHEEGTRVLKRLYRTLMPQDKREVSVVVGNGRALTSVDKTSSVVRITYAPSRDWYSIVHGMVLCLPVSEKMGTYKAINAGIKRGYFAGLLKPEPKAPKPPPTKEDKRALKIKRLEAREAAWVKKQQRAATALKKIRRSLNATRRHA